MGSPCKIAVMRNNGGVEFLKRFSPEQLLVINALIVTLLAIYFLVGRRQQKPTSLQMTDDGVASDSTESPSLSNGQVLSASSDARSSKNLNVVFMYNQHTFDAYEVLGIPAGSSMAVIKEAYDDMLREIPGDRRPLVKAAFEAIEKDRQLH